MPTTLGRSYQKEWLGRPPHMLESDVPVWWRFLNKWGWQFKNIYYDVLLGGPRYTETQLKDPLIRMWRQQLSKRADAIAELSEQVWIIEVSFSPGLRSIGQLQTYRALWTRDIKIFKPEKPVLVCEEIEPDLLDAATMHGIMVFVLGPS